MIEVGGSGQLYKKIGQATKKQASEQHFSATPCIPQLSQHRSDETKNSFEDLGRREVFTCVPEEAPFPGHTGPSQGPICFRVEWCILESSTHRNILPTEGPQSTQEGPPTALKSEVWRG